MASDSIECSDEDLEPLIRNTFAVQLGNSSTDTSESTDVGIVRFKINSMTLVILVVDTLECSVIYDTCICRQLLILKRKLEKWLTIDQVVLAMLPTMHMMLYGPSPLELSGIHIII